MLRFDGQSVRNVEELQECSGLKAFGDRIVLPQPELRRQFDTLDVIDADGVRERLAKEELGIDRFGAYFGSGQRLYFSAEDPEHGREPWVSDGTASNTRRIMDVFPGPASSIGQLAADTFIAEPRLGAGGAYFVAQDPEHGYRVWVTDGTTEGTEPVDAQPDGRGLAPPRLLGRTDGHVYWTAVVDGAGTQVHRLDRPAIEIDDGPAPRPPVDARELGTASGCSAQSGAALHGPLGLLLAVVFGLRRRYG